MVQTVQLTNQSSGDLTFVSASAYSFDELAEIYNQARVDYIVPMPMNGKRMAEYVRDYDIDLNISTVARDHDGLEMGVIMLGARPNRAWITRLGVIPARRGSRVGQRLVELMIEASLRRGLRHIQMEVIRGNAPAYSLFRKLGFEDVRELLVIRRPPSPTAPLVQVEGAQAIPLEGDEIMACLQKRGDDPAWTEETRSFAHMEGLKGLRCALASGESGWAVYQRAPFQLMHFVFSPDASPDLHQALIYHIHKLNPLHDTKIENLPASHPAWQVYQRMGYVESFRRIEMRLTL
jgi:ribosomal protein S18 acetylase RimI-like enzyme